MQLVNEVQAAFLHLQAECEKLHECNRNLQEENREKQIHIQVQAGPTAVSTSPRRSFVSFGDDTLFFDRNC